MFYHKCPFPCILLHNLQQLCLAWRTTCFVIAWKGIRLLSKKNFTVDFILLSEYTMQPLTQWTSDFYSVRLYSITRLRQFITMYTQPLLVVVSVHSPRSLALTPSSFLNRLRITLAVWPPVYPRERESHPESPRSLIQVPICPLEVKREPGDRLRIPLTTTLDITYLFSFLHSQTFSSTRKKTELINYTMRWQNKQTSNTLITQVQDFCAKIIDIFATLMPNHRGAWAWPLLQCP